MVDFLSTRERSERMSRIRGKHTRPEIIVRSLLHRAGFRFRLHVSRLAGRPDLVLRKYGAAIFVNGCFWHRHAGCKVASTPKSNVEFWKAKFSANVKRDKRNQAKLRRQGWRVFVLWECQVTASSRSRKLIDRLTARLISGQQVTGKESSGKPRK